jgi:uncharacterized membrane protein YgcG
MGELPWRFIVGSVALAGCNPSVADYCSPGSPECSAPDAAAGDAGRDGGAEAEVAPSGCDPTKPPYDEACVIDDAFGIFVSLAGSDANPGLKSAPVRSIGHGMDLAKAAAKRVYICAGSYPEQLMVGSSRDGVNVYGALDCATWTYSAANKVIVAPAQAGYALEIQGLQTGVTFEDIEFDAQNASAGVPGASSVAVFVSTSQGISFDRVTMVAGSANDGAPGGSTGTATNWFGTPPAYAELAGNNADDAGGAPTKQCTCGDQSQTSGGQGGGPMNIPSPGAGAPAYSDAGAGAGGMNAVVCGSGGSPPTNGADAPMPLAEAPSTSLGTCSAGGWVPGVGVPGTDGKPGQGGGGGGNGRLSSGSGGSGACGGCGGAGGKPGQGGGASIALLSFQSSIALADCTLTANAAGGGSAGGAAEAGQGGGLMGGNGNLGCQGSAGGAGAGGNGGQGGPGGLSLGIGYVGTPPTIDGAVVTQASTHSGIAIGAAGAGGAGGLRGASATNSTGPAGALGASGQPGVAAAVEAVP